MKKNIKFCIIILILVLVLVLVSCSKSESDDSVKVWMYRYSGDSGGYNEIIDLIESEIVNYAAENEIKVEILNYKEGELSLEDYKLKKNLALEHGDADIVIGDMYSDMTQMSEYAGDYTKLENYKNIFENFKGKYCIPIGSLMKAIVLDNEVLNSYGIQCDKYITLDEYYDIKQSLKEKGAKLKYNRVEELQLFNYYTNKNNLELLEKDGKYTIDRELGMKTIKEISEDILKHYNYDMDENKRIEKLYSENYEEIIYDEASGRALAQREESIYPLKFLSFTGDHKLPYEDYTIVLRNDIENCMNRIPCLFINKKTENNNTYKIADFLISDILQRRIYNNTLASTIIDTSEVKEKIEYNDDWSYKYVPAKTKIYNQGLNKTDIKGIIDAVQKSYGIFKNIDAKKFFYESLEYKDEVRKFVIEEVYRIIENQNYDETEFNKDADEFLTNFNVLNN